MFHADALAGYDWVRWTAEGLEFSIPASPKLLAKLATTALSEIGKTSNDQAQTTISNFRSMALLLAPPSKLTVQDNHVSILFGSESDGHLRVHVPLETAKAKSLQAADEYSPALRDYLQESGMELPSSGNM